MCVYRESSGYDKVDFVMSLMLRFAIPSHLYNHVVAQQSSNKIVIEILFSKGRPGRSSTYTIVDYLCANPTVVKKMIIDSLLRMCRQMGL